ncbi:unnamed protein product [Rhodiola kirilowii]
MSQAEGNRKGSVDPEQPPHVYGTAAPRYAPGIITSTKLITKIWTAVFLGYITIEIDVSGIEVVEGIPVREPLPCCGLGFGWTLFILGFFITIPWYIGAVLLIYVIRKKDYREKPGCIACLVGAVIITIIIILQIVGVLNFNYTSN